MSTPLYNKYQKGSEWRRWDLHIHTPETNKNDQFTGSNIEEKWTNYCSSINSYTDEISVIGITDYFSIDNYFKFKEKIESGAITKSFDLILPNIELRISPVTGSSIPINIHCIFDSEIENELQDRFFAKLKFSYSGSDFSATRSELIRLGKKYNGETSISDEEAYRKGVNQYVIEFKNLKSIFSEDPELREKTIIVVSNSSNDGASGLTHADLFDGASSQLDATRQSIYQFTDAIFSANPKDRTYFLGQGVDDEKKVITKCGSLKPCFHGCDAHSNDKIFSPVEDRFCWIKSDPTFEGLKQVLYEPMERVTISDEKPEDKLLYHIIDKVKFQDSSFTTNEIEINQNLTAIIGGKSTGKSILLRNIAKSIDSEEYLKRLETVGLSDSRPIQGMEVYWKDGQVSKLDSENNPNKRIIYIPQSYLNRVVDDEKRNTDIDEIIREVLLQDEDFSTWFSSLTLKEKLINDNIESGIKSLYDNIAIYNENNSELKKIGDEKGVAEQIKKITQEIKDIQSKLNLKQEDIDSFNSQLEQIKKDKLTIDNLKEDVKALNQLKEVQVSVYNSFEFIFKSPEISDEIDQINENKRAIYSSDWKKTLEGVIEKYSKELNNKIEVNNKAIEALKPLQEKVDSQKNLTKKYKELDDEQKKQQIILKLKEKKNDAKKTIDQIVIRLSEFTSEYYSIYLEAKDKINLDSLDDELVFDIKTEFRDIHFTNTFIRVYFDGRSIGKSEFDYITGYQFQSKETFKEFIHKLIWEILHGKLPRKDDGSSSKEVVSGLLKNWFLHNYKVEYQGDQINDMSPGKKSFVLLRLLVDLDNSKCPILIDQPEDDLDNRSIYNQVVKFLRRRKTERQIIIATHNPNLVLGADAEQIIVANQDGKDTKNLSSKFEYVSGGIEHTKIEDKTVNEVLYKRGIQEHVCEILEGGEEAFTKRKSKYSFT